MKKYSFAPLPQPDRGLGYEPRRRGFESLKARQRKNTRQGVFFFGSTMDSNPERARSVKQNITPPLYFAYYKYGVI